MTVEQGLNRGYKAISLYQYFRAPKGQPEATAPAPPKRGSG